MSLTIFLGRYGLVCLELWTLAGYCLQPASISRFEPLFVDQVVLSRVVLLRVMCILWSLFDRFGRCNDIAPLLIFP